LVACTLFACGPEGLWPELDAPLSTGEKHRLAPSSFGHVIEATGGWWLVLDHRPSEQWRVGDPSLANTGDPGVVVLEAEVDRATLPAQVLAWHGRQVQLLDREQPRCIGVVGRVALLGPLEPPIGFPGDDGAHMSEADLARTLWGMSAPVLAARLELVSGDCSGSTWGRAADTPAPLIARGMAAPPELASSALAAFQQLQAYAEIDQAYHGSDNNEDNDEDKAGPWENADGGSPDVSLFEDQASGAALVVVSVMAGSHCSEFLGQLTGVWRVVGDRLELLGVAEDYVVPEAAVDLEGDGTPELLFYHGVLQLEGGVAKQHELKVAYFGCPC